MTFRKVLFWMHLIAGSIAGTIVLVMSVTGLMLTYERQILARADRGAYRAAPAAGQQRLSVDDLLARIEAAQPLSPNSSLVLRSDPAEPVEVSLGREGSVYANPYDGRILGRGDPETRRWFQKITGWHRWLGSEGEGRATARAITGACNLAFLFLVLSGMYLWLPSLWTMRYVRPILWFRQGLSGKARDFNWHNVFGIWASIPLLIVVASAIPMSYGWANDLLYRITGSEVPARGPGGGGPPSQQRRQQQPAESRPSLNSAWAIAEQKVPGWQSISMRLAASSEVVFTIDSGDGGQPQKRANLTLDLNSGEVKKWEPFSSNSAGRQLRMWSRFAHTGEYYGVVGQTIAGIGCLAGVMLVWTGIALALRRLNAWQSRRKRREVKVPEPVLQ